MYDVKVERTNAAQQNNDRGVRRKPRRGWKEWWLQLTAPRGAADYGAVTLHREREHLRRAGLTSFVAPFVFIAPLFFLQQAEVDPVTSTGIVIMMSISVVALILNRFGKQVAAAILLIFSMDAVLEGALLSARGGLGAGWLLTFDLFIIPLITVGVLLSRRYLWIFAGIHIACILGDFFWLPHAPDLEALINVWHGPAVAFARPLIIQIGGLLLSFIEVGSTDQAIARADRAEDLAKLQHKIAQQRQQLEVAAQQILETHAKVANGNYKTRAQVPQGNILWEVAQSLNKLLERLERAFQAENKLFHTENQLQRLAAAIDEAKTGQHPFWPAPNGTAADMIIERIVQQPGTSNLRPSSPPGPGQKYVPPPYPRNNMS